MRVFLDLTPLVTVSSLRGIGRYVRGLAQGLVSLTHEERRGVEVIGLGANHALTRLHHVSDLAAHCAMPVQAPIRGAGRRRDRLLSFAAPRLVESCGLLHLAEPKGYPRSRSMSVTATAHDLISLALPDLYLPPIPYWSRLVAARLRLRYARYHRIIAVSHATKRDICRMIGIAAERVDVVEHGVDHSRFAPESDERDAQRVADVVGDAEQPFVLYVGAGDARKDLDCLVRAFARSRARSQAKLVLVGRHEAWRVKALTKLIHTLGIETRVIRTGYLDEELVPALYRRARVHAFVSRYEGFGLPVLEAMACGTRTITSPGSSLDEVAGDAALVVPCANSELLGDAIDQLFFDETLRTALSERGLSRARSFTWRSCAQKTVDFFKSVEAEL